LNAMAAPSDSSSMRRPALPDSFRAGALLTPELHGEIQRALKEYDQLLEACGRKQKQITEEFRALEKHLHSVLSHARVPLQGWAIQKGGLAGYFSDGWIGPAFSGTFLAQRKIHSITVKCHVPDHAKLPMHINVATQSAFVEGVLKTNGMHEIVLSVGAESGDQLGVRISCSTCTSGQSAGVNGDARELSVILAMLVFE
jgi:hypothetical protein